MILVRTGAAVIAPPEAYARLRLSKKRPGPAVTQVSRSLNAVQPSAKSTPGAFISFRMVAVGGVAQAPPQRSIFEQSFKRIGKRLSVPHGHEEPVSCGTPFLDQGNQGG
jgi:hypothetical protein